MNLVKEEYSKVTTDQGIYYFQTKAFCSDSDGEIIVNEISEDIFEGVKYLNYGALEIDIRNAPMHLRRTIEKMEGGN